MKLHTKRGVKNLEIDCVLLQTVLDTVLANYEVADTVYNVQYMQTYTMFRKKVAQLIFGHSFCKCGPIFKILSPTDSQ